MDVFRVRKTVDKFVRPLNLGPTINGKGDDYAFILANEQRGYITSNKKEGIGGSDVYKFKLKHNQQLMKGQVIDTKTLQPILNSNIIIIDAENNIVSSKINTDGTFSAYIDPYEVYIIKTTKKGYDDNQTLLTTNSATQRTFETTVYLKQILESKQTLVEIIKIDGKKMIKTENIYFDFNKSNIRSDSKKSLNKIAIILTNNPNIKIEVNAHTDIKGSNKYNLAISNKRAEATMKHLIHLGIKPNRMISKGYGETQPLIDCISKKCSDKEHEINRRIEFIIISE